MIRKATEDDLDRLHDLFYLEYSETRATMAEMRYRIEDIIFSFLMAIRSEEYGCLFVKELDGKIVGYIFGQYLKTWAGNFNAVLWHEIAWYVLKEHRKKGYGLELYRAAEQSVFDLGLASAICISTAFDVDHEHLLKRYQEAGFVPLQIMSFKPVPKKEVVKCLS
jgi:GNAT superfamily N-acetyltransferase